MSMRERQDRILAWVEEAGALTIERLAEHFEVSTQTIRKDINALCDTGLLRRVHGGVQLPSASQNISVTARHAINAGAKAAIAAHAARDLPADASVFLGIGTTAEHVARALVRHKGLTVITNNFNAAQILGAGGEATVLLAGGRLRPDDGDVVGPDTVSCLEGFSADIGIVGAGGLSTDGLLDFQAEEAAVTRAILANSRRRILVADREKWRRAALVKVADFDRIDAFYTDAVPDDRAVAEALSTLELVRCPISAP